MRGIKVVAVSSEAFCSPGPKARHEAVTQRRSARKTRWMKAESTQFAVANHVGDESKDTDVIWRNQ